jgi:hypothetical protein
LVKFSPTHIMAERPSKTSGGYLGLDSAFALIEGHPA